MFRLFRGIEDGKWNHIPSYNSGSFDGYELKFYLNGQLEGEEVETLETV